MERGVGVYILILCSLDLENNFIYCNIRLIWISAFLLSTSNFLICPWYTRMKIVYQTYIHIYIYIYAQIYKCVNGFLGGSVVKNPLDNAGDAGSIPGLGRSPGVGNGNPLQFLPREPHGQRSLTGYSPRGRKRVGHDLATKQQQQNIWVCVCVCVCVCVVFLYIEKGLYLG